MKGYKLKEQILKEEGKEFQLEDDYLIIQMPREVDHFAAGYVSERADSYILKGQAIHIVFNFQNTVFCDSAGIGIIVGRQKKVADIGGKVYIVGASFRIKRMLYMSGLMNIVEVISAEQLAK